MKIVAAQKILKANDQLAAENRAALNRQGVFCVNLVGSPGAGKTTLIEGLLAKFAGRLKMAVIEGDIAGSIDAERLDALGVPVVQINTDGACHLDAGMIAAAKADFELAGVDVLVIENVGNLVCTAGFDLGEHVRVVVLSVPEGDDKIAKYPAIFHGSQALVITKTDLAPHIKFSAERVRSDMRRLAPDAQIFEVCATSGDGIAPLVEWLSAKRRDVEKEA